MLGVYHPFLIVSISLLFAKLFHFLASKKGLYCLMELSPFLVTFLFGGCASSHKEHTI